MYTPEGNAMVFEGSLEEYLCEKGVSREHIDKMKNKVLQGTKGAYYNLPEPETKKFIEERRQIPLDKVIGTGRGTVGVSVFENVRRMEDGERSSSRFEGCFKFLDKMSLEELKESYKKLPRPVEMDYYVEDDEYFLSGDGNHRTLTAMLVGAEYIDAMVTEVHCNYERKEKMETTKKFFEKYNIVEMREFPLGTEVEFFENDEAYTINGFCHMKGYGEDFYSFLSRIEEQLMEDRKCLAFIEKIPRPFRKLICRYLGNRRLLQYINKSNKINGHDEILLYIMGEKE